jgi:predicted Zn-dependent peptidase
MSLNLTLIACAAFVSVQAPPRPSVPPPPRFVAPAVNRTTLPNGLAVSRVQFGTTPTARVELVIRAGIADESADEAGTAESVAEYLLEGTASLSAGELAEKISAMGVLFGNLRVSAGAYETTIAADVLSDAAPALIEVLGEVVRNPAFPQGALDRIKLTRTRRAAALRTQVPSIAMLRANSILFPGHPADRIYSEEEIRGLDIGKLRAFHRSRYVASRARLYIAGVFDDQAVDAAVREAFSPWQSGTPTNELRTSMHSPGSGVSDTGAPIIHFIHHPNMTQARLHVAAPIVDQMHPDHLVLNELNILMGSVQTSRIIQNVRERHGYSYNVSSRLNRRPGSSQWTVTADVASDVAGKALSEILGEIARLPVQPPDERELHRYQTFMAGGLIYENSSAQGVIESLRWIDFYQADPTYFTDFVGHLLRVKPGDIERVARMYLAPGRLVIVVVGDREAVLPQLRTLGRVVE